MGQLHALQLCCRLLSDLWALCFRLPAPRLGFWRRSAFRCVPRHSWPAASALRGPHFHLVLARAAAEGARPSSHLVSLLAGLGSASRRSSALGTMLTTAREALRRAGQRPYSVVAWGRNTEGQCGVSGHLPLVLQAREVDAFSGHQVSCLAASKAHSAAVLANGEAFTWGEGSEGKLGHGCTDNAYLPHCVESLAGRVHVTSIALGRQHTLFVDSTGQAWACGENREAQCGLGTPLEEIARQQRQQWDAAAFLPWASGGGGGAAAAGVAAPSSSGRRPGGQGQLAAAVEKMAADAQQQLERNLEIYAQLSGQGAWHNTYLKPFLEHRGRAAQLEAAISIYDSDMRSLLSQKSAWQRFEAARGADINIPGLMPGQIATPVRLGRGRQGIFSPQLPELAGLDAEHIVQVSAGRFMSAALTASREVWTFGGGFSGELGGGFSGELGSGAAGASMSPAPRRVDGVLAQVLQDNGGAVKLATGGMFCCALTRSGRVVIWGQPMGSEAAGAAGGPAAAAAAESPAAAFAAAAAGPAAWGRRHGRRRRQGWMPHRQRAAPQALPAAAAAAAEAAAAAAAAAGAAAGASGAAGSEQEVVENLRIQKQGGMVVAEVVDLPPMKDLACGFSHLAFTDGESVWTVGRQLVPGSPACTAGLHWLQPRRVMRRPDDGVSSLAAGSFASAAITGAGDLYMWGSLLTEEACAALLKDAEEEGLGHWAFSASASDPAALKWSAWEGLGGGLEPRLVPGLHKVQQVALGTHHALAVLA